MNTQKKSIETPQNDARERKSNIKQTKIVNCLEEYNANFILISETHLA